MPNVARRVAQINTHATWGLPPFVFARKYNDVIRAKRLWMTSPKGGLNEGFAGLPASKPDTQPSGAMTAGHLSAAHLPDHRARPFRRFRLSKEIVGADWDGSGHSDDDLCFGMTEITTAQRLRASKLAGGAKMDFQAVNLEQTIQCIYMIGNRATNNNRGVIKGWYDAIGPKGQDVVERIFADMTSATETEVQSIMSAGSWEEG